MPRSKAPIRTLNGYRVVYLPGHVKAMTSKNWSGYVYEHIVVLEKKLGRELLPFEVVHHKDNNRSNSCEDNLEVKSRSGHTLEHNNSRFGSSGSKYCLHCGKLFKGRKKFCSRVCYRQAARIVDRPSSTVLLGELQSMSMRAIGKKYGVSDSSVRKWARAYGLL
jgi:hypothetical protein